MKLLALIAFLSWIPAHAEEPVNLLDELNPFDPKVEEMLDAYDSWYEEGTGLAARLPMNLGAANCFRSTCPVWARVIKSQQTLYLYVNGVSYASWLVSTGAPGYTTPNFDTHPDGRIYDRYTSTKYPGGDWNGLGNMPYAVFIRGGFAIHGTGQSNWPKLGHTASHGCIRLHPNNAYEFNRMVRSQGIGNVWVTVEN